MVSLPHYRLQNSTLRVVDDFCDLGFLIRSNINFDAHYKSFIKMANFRTYNLFKVLNSSCPDLLLVGINITRRFADDKRVHGASSLKSENRTTWFNDFSTPMRKKKLRSLIT